MTLRQLLQAKAQATDAAKALQVAANGRAMTAEETKAFDEHIATAESLQADIDRANKLAALERSPAATPGASVGNDNRADKPWRCKAEQLIAIARGTRLIEQGRAHQVDPRINAALGADETVPSDGGFLVAPDYSTDLLQRIYNTGEVAKLITSKNTEKARVVINAVDEDSRVDGSRWGGILAYWLAESATYTSSKPKFREIQLTMNKLIALIYATEELLDDTSLFESYINEVVPQEFAFKRDTAIISGTGAGQPLGILTAPSTIVQAADSGDSGTVPVDTNDILNMWSRLFAPYRKDAVWFINQAIEPFLYPLTLGAPSLGQILMYTPPGTNGNNSGYGLLMGRPVIPIEQCSAVGTAGDIILWSPSSYILVKRNDVRADSSIHVAFLTGEKAFRFMLREDGQPWMKKPLTPYQSSAPTLSGAVVLNGTGR